MDKKAVLKVVARFRRALGAHGIREARIVLYGSHADGTAHEGSDIDLVVISEDFAGKAYWDRIEILAEAVAEVWEPIEAVAMTPGEWAEGASIIVDYAKDGEVL